MKNTERICCDCENVIVEPKYIRCEQCIAIRQLQLPENFFDKETGLKLVIQERLKVLKGSRGEAHDLWVNGDRQMTKVAKKLLYTHSGGPTWFNLLNPFNWHKPTWRKMMHSTYKRRLVIAGQLICAELDRIINKGEN